MKFTKEKFKIYHPGGNIGQTLLLVKDIMIRERNKIPLINFNSNIITAVKTISKKNLGIGIIIKNKSVIGIVTDGDIRRGAKNYSKRTKITVLMSRKPLYVGENTSAAKALSIMNEKKLLVLSYLQILIIKNIKFF
jgi:arabinose-5-phosphate isomerase